MRCDHLPDKWSWTTLGEVVETHGRAIVSGPFGSNIGSRFFVEKGVPVIRGNNLTKDMCRFIDDGFVFVTEDKANELGNCEAISDDLVFTAAGSLGQVGLIPKDAKYPRYIISNKQLRARVDTRIIDPLFAFYWFASKEMVEYIQQRNTGSSVPLINLSVLRSLPLPLPPLPKQRAIAHILGTLDDMIELNRRMNATLEAMARALFRSWFVDFDPVRAKAEGREPAGMDAATAALFPDEFEESELGEIPKGWEVKRIDELAEINSWSLTNSYTIDPIDYIEISEVSKGEVYSIQRYPRGKEPSRARRRLRHGDTVLSTVRPDRESYFLCYEPEPSLIASTGFAVVTPTIAPWTFVYVALTRPEIFEYLGQVADGGAYPAIRADVIAGIETIWPNVPELGTKYHQITERWLAMAERNKQQSRTLAALRDILLPELLSGRAQINDKCGSVG